MFHLWLALPLLSLFAQPDPPTLRGVIVEALQPDGALDVHLSKELPKLKTLNAVSYRVLLLDEEGRERPADPLDFRFRVGDRFRIEIETHTDQYIYVFHEDQKGERVLLIPQPGTKTPKTQQAGKIVIPEGDRWFRFTPPAGRELMHVVASTAEIKQLVPPKPLRTPEEIQEAKELQNDVIEAIAKATKRIETSSVSEISQKLAAEPIENLRNIEFRGIARKGWSTVAKGSFQRNASQAIHVQIELVTTEPATRTQNP